MKLDLVVYLYWDLWRFFSALFTGKKLKATKEEAKQRLNICLACPLVQKESRFLWYKQPRCSICGCYIKYKSRFIIYHCEDNPSKW